MSTQFQKVFCVNENISPIVAKAVNQIFKKVTVRHVRTHGFRGLTDIELFSHLKSEGVDALITLDRRQLINPNERQALKDNNLHWVGLPPNQARGVEQFANQTSAILAAIPLIISHWQTTPMQYEIRQPRTGKLTYKPL